MKITDTRKNRLIELIGDPSIRGAVSEFARMYNLDPTYIRQIITDHRTLGEKAARNLEEKIGLPHFYLDGTKEDELTLETGDLDASERKQVLSFIRFLKSSRGEAS